MGVYKEGKNWKVQVYYKDWQGNQKRKQKRGFRTKGEAKEWERDFLQQQSQGVDIEFGNFLEIYYKDMDVRLREHTMYTNSKASKTLPAQLIEKAYEQLDNVDTNVFKKLSDDEKDNIRSKLDLVQEMIDSIRGELDV